jgi:hypothetical protein
MSGTDARVGPVLVDGDVSRAVIAAIRELNDDVSVQDRGAYLRVEVPCRCIVTRAAIERATGRPFQLPGDLERIMPSFKGKLSIAEDSATWEVRR